MEEGAFANAREDLGFLEKDYDTLNSDSHDGNADARAQCVSSLLLSPLFVCYDVLDTFHEQCHYEKFLGTSIDVFPESSRL